MVSPLTFYKPHYLQILADCSTCVIFKMLPRPLLSMLFTSTVWLKISQYLLEGSWTFSLRFKRRETPSISSQSRIPLLGAADSSSLTPAAGTQSPVRTQEAALCPRNQLTTV